MKPMGPTEPLMQTELLRANVPAEIACAVNYVRQAQPVVFPTDTLYGIGVDPFQEQALDRLYHVKRRPINKGIPVLLSDGEVLERVAIDVSPVARLLIARFWPGPLTLIVPRHPALPGKLSPDGNVAVRIPDHEISRAFIRLCGGALATSSANHSEEPPAMTAAEALAVFAGEIPAVLDGGPVTYGQSSTIVDCTVEPAQILRAGPITAEMLFA
jgi:L-threonylcarbamoyladenylate synthase